MIIENSPLNPDRAIVSPENDGELRALFYGGLPLFHPSRLSYLMKHTVGTEETMPSLEVSNSTVENIGHRLTNLVSRQGLLRRFARNVAYGPHFPSLNLIDNINSSVQEYLSSSHMEEEEAKESQPQPLRLPRPLIVPRNVDESIAGRPSRQVAGRIPLNQILERAASYRR